MGFWSVAGQALKLVLAPLDRGGVAPAHADHSGDGDERRDQVLGLALPVGVRGCRGQLDEDQPVSREGQPHDELDLPREVVQRVGDHDDDVTVGDEPGGACGVLDRTGRVLLGQHRERVVGDHLAGVLVRSSRLAGGALGAGTVGFAVVAAGPHDLAPAHGRPEVCDVGRDRDGLQDPARVVEVERTVLHHATSTEVHDGDVLARQDVHVQAGLPVGAAVAQDLHGFTSLSTNGAACWGGRDTY